jgi:superfamily II RNA helicase
MVVLCDKPYEGEVEMQYPYPLSDFQKYAIDAIIKEQHVLVTAHTGSGKTLPAEFAIQHFVSKGKKVIYTSPIKALSNQKFYDFTHKYPHISFGLLTGDIKTNPTADVLIMTTEILMNALFTQDNQSAGELSFQMDLENELGCVIFDEVHYINDADRGQTWEQTILMLPYHVQMVMLSATIDNPVGFAQWIENRDPHKSKQVYLASTEKRVVPLTHYGFFATTETPFKTIKDKTIQQQIRDATNRLVLLRTPEGVFKETGYHTIKTMSNLFDKHQMFMKRKFVLNKLAEFLRENEMLPAIVFVFSRKSVEQCAKDITTNLLEDDSKIPYIVRQECEQIVRRFPNYKEYLELPEYNELVALLEKGVGIHHSGMIPVLREIVELMISKKYIKMLFATESFAIGLDCPIKTAVFSSLQKFDGTKMRALLPHEYTQMAGRAGRRGIDTVGHVVHCNNLFALPTLPEYNMILCGKPQKLVSKFKISYPMILNLMKRGQTTGFDEFANRSMMKEEIDATLRGSRASVIEQESLCDKKTECLALLRTPMDICREYMEMEAHMSMYNAKKRKECERTIKTWKEDYRTFAEDVAKVKELEELKQTIVKERKDMEYMENYMAIHVENICKIMAEADILQDNVWGKMAAQLHEIHPLLGVDLLRYTEFTKYSAKEIACVLSIFTDVKVPEEQRVLQCKRDDISLVCQKAEYYAQREVDLGLYTGYDPAFTYDLVSIMGEWCECQTEENCKWFLQRTLGEISLGDFTKAVLKIVVIAKEFQTIAEQMGNMAFLQQLKDVEILLCKYVATNQSLYV